MMSKGFLHISVGDGNHVTKPCNCRGEPEIYAFIAVKHVSTYMALKSKQL